MPLTPVHSIYYPDSQMNVTPLESHFAALATSVDNALEGALAPPTPIYPTLLNGWEDYGGSFARAHYYKDPFGRVFISGFIRRGTGSDVFQLPAGYRPGHSHSFMVSASPGSSAISVRLDVTSGGFVTFRDMPVTSGWATLECSFLAGH